MFRLSASLANRLAYRVKFAVIGALVAAGYDGYMNWEFCHPARKNGKPADINYVHNQTRLALEYMRSLRAEILQQTQSVAAS